MRGLRLRAPPLLGGCLLHHGIPSSQGAAPRPHRQRWIACAACAAMLGVRLHRGRAARRSEIQVPCNLEIDVHRRCEIWVRGRVECRGRLSLDDASVDAGGSGSWFRR